MAGLAIRSKQAISILRLSPGAFWELLVATGNAWSAHNVPKMGAALSYYTAFSLGPLIVFILSLASLVVKKKDATYYIVQEVTGLMGAKGGATVQEILTHASSTKTLSWGTAISFIILLAGSSGAFGELQDSLNQIWEVPPRKHPFLTMIKERALSFVMVFVLGFFMLVSLLLSAFIAILNRAMVYQFPLAGIEVANTLISFVVFTGLFSVIFWMLPDVTLRWSDVWSGAVLSSALFILGKFLLGWYIGFSSTFSSYGAFGSFVVILVWVFYSAQILFFGAEFSRAYTIRHGSLHGQKKSAPSPLSTAEAKT